MVYKRKMQQEYTLKQISISAHFKDTSTSISRRHQILSFSYFQVQFICSIIEIIFFFFKVESSWIYVQLYAIFCLDIKLQNFIFSYTDKTKSYPRNFAVGLNFAELEGFFFNKNINFSGYVLENLLYFSNFCKIVQKRNLQILREDKKYLKWDGNCSSLKRPFTELSFPIKCPGSIQKNKIDRHKASKLKLYALLALLQRSCCEIKVRISWVPLRNSSPSETSVSLYKAHGFVGLMEKIPLFINFPFSFKPTSYLTLLSSALSTRLSDDISSLFPPALQSTTFFSIQNCNPLLVLYFLDNYISVFSSSSVN